MADHLVRALLAGQTVRVVAAITTDTAREAARRHDVAGGAAVALARATTSALLLATLTKGGERVTLQVLGDGPLGGVTADANDAGEVRAYLARAQVRVPGAAGRRVSLASAVGRGSVNVLRELGLREQAPYVGQAGIVTGEIDEDVEHYLRVSEQIDSALCCDAVLGEDLGIAAAGGVLVQRMPDGPAEDAALVRTVQHHMRGGAVYDALALVPPVTDAMELADAVLEHALAAVLDVRPICFRCRCSRARVADTLAILGKAELDDMIREDRPQEVVCHFCNEHYEVSRAELERLRRLTAET